jgi:hypothetical protein
MRTYQNEHNMLMNFRRYLILPFQTSKTANNVLGIDAIYNLKLRKYNLILHTALLSNLMGNFHDLLPLCQNNVNAF